MIVSRNDDAVLIHFNLNVAKGRLQVFEGQHGIGGAKGDLCARKKQDLVAHVASKIEIVCGDDDRNAA